MRTGFEGKIRLSNEMDNETCSGRAESQRTWKEEVGYQESQVYVGNACFSFGN